MLKETLGAAVLGLTLLGVPGTAAAATGGGATAPQAARESLTVSIDTDRRGRHGVVRILVREADDRSPVRGIRACLQTKNRNHWRTFDCERTNRWGRADWRVRAHRHTTFRIFIPRTHRYHSYYSEQFRLRWDRDQGRTWNRNRWDGDRDRNRWNRNRNRDRWNNGREVSGVRGFDGERRRGRAESARAE
jgi:hypothetical protein